MARAFASHLAARSRGPSARARREVPRATAVAALSTRGVGIRCRARATSPRASRARRTPRARNRTSFSAVAASRGARRRGGDGGKNQTPGRRGWSTPARGALFVAASAYVAWTHLSASEEDDVERERATVENWSGTKRVECEKVLTPESAEALERAVRSGKHRKLRPCGSALSPNGVAFEERGMLSMALLDEVLEVDAEKKLLRVQAGARVREVVEALRPHGLTLQNYASIREQQMGGFTQVGAHGTGARIPPVDETVVEMKLVTPARGTLTLSATSEPELFKLAKCGIGALGAVTELTIKVRRRA